jgi:hypothetical protein
MQFSNTTTKDGLIQHCEFWTNSGDAGISGDATLLKVFTNRINFGFDRLMPLLLSYCDHIRWDDTNHTANPWGTFTLTSGQADYNIGDDGSSLDVLNITRVTILPSSSATVHTELERMTVDDENALVAMTGATSGIPTHFLERNNAIYLYPKPNYTVSAGIRVFFEREQSYFASTDTTKEPGIPKPFHGLLPLYAAYDWLIVNKPDQGTLISRIEAQIARMENNLKDMISMKTPVVQRAAPARQDNR